jgi:hypothetical protein
MRQHPNRYADHDGPPRAVRNLDDWTQEKCRADRDLDAEIDARDDADKKRRAAIPDVYEVADRVLAPLLAEVDITSVPRRLKQDVDDALAARGVKKPNRKQKITEAMRLLAGDKAAGDIELSLGLTLAAALLWEPQGGWKAHAPRGPRREGFTSLRHVLAAAFEDVTLGVSAIPLEVAQNRARTRSIDGECFISASHSSSGRARNASALDRTIDAQALIFRSTVDVGLVPLLFERHVMGKHQSRDAMLEELHRREARSRKKRTQMVNVNDPSDTHFAMMPTVSLPPRPGKGATDSELAAWRLACGVLLWGEAPDQEQHNRKHDGALLRAVRDAEDALRKAMGIEVPPRPARPSRISEAGYANA